MDFDELVQARRSVRRFEDRKLPCGTIEGLLEAARWAPSAGNRQPWRLVVVRNAELIGRLDREAYGGGFFADVPVVIVVCAEPKRSAARYGERGRKLYCLQDTAAAVQNILLAARARGLGSCWLGAFDEEACARILDLGENLRPVAMIPVGYPAREPSPPRRRELEEIVEYRD